MARVDRAPRPLTSRCLIALIALSLCAWAASTSTEPSASVSAPMGDSLPVRDSSAIEETAGRAVDAKTPGDTVPYVDNGAALDATPVAPMLPTGTGPDAERPTHAPLIRRLAAAIRSSSPYRAIRIYGPRVILLLIFVGMIALSTLFLLQKADRKRFVRTARLAIMDKEVQRACRYIEKHHDEVDITPESISEELVTGKAFLEALFQQELGMSIIDFVAQVRINRAKDLLARDPGIAVEDLAARTGFADRSEFHGTFVRVAGTNAEEFRRSARAQRSKSGN